MEAYTYILHCADGTLYTGWTNDLQKRLSTHNSGQGAKYTKTRLPVTLLYYEQFTDKIAAQKREYAIKHLSRQQKLSLIAAGRVSSFQGQECHVLIHQYEMTEGSAEAKEVEDLV